MMDLKQKMDAFFADAIAHGDDHFVSLHRLPEAMPALVGYHTTLACFAYHAAALGDIAEIGTCYGLGTLSLEHGVSLREVTRKIVTIEIDPKNCNNAAMRASRLQLAGIHFVAGTSARLADYGNAYALVYVDGAHDYDSCLKDLNNAAACLMDGGKILCHDYNADYDRNEVVAAVDTFLKNTLGWHGFYVGDGFLLLGRDDTDPGFMGGAR